MNVGQRRNVGSKAQIQPFITSGALELPFEVKYMPTNFSDSCRVVMLWQTTYKLIST